MARMAVDIRSVLIPLTGKRVLLPNATVAEVITYSTPESIEGTPGWVMGRVVWRGWWVPVFSLPMLGGWAERENEAGAKIAVLKALGGNPDMPFMAMVTQGFPRLVTVTADSLQVVDGSTPDTAAAPAEPAAAAGDEAPGAAETAEEDDLDLSDFTVELDDESLQIDMEDEDGTEAEPAAETPPEPTAETEAEVGAAEPPAAAADDFDPIAAVVIVSGERAVIPDLVPIERRVAKAVGPEVLKRRR